MIKIMKFTRKNRKKLKISILIFFNYKKVCKNFYFIFRFKYTKPSNRAANKGTLYSKKITRKRKKKSICILTQINRKTYLIAIQATN